jgi:hypothetical protein
LTIAPSHPPPVRRETASDVLAPRCRFAGASFVTAVEDGHGFVSCSDDYHSRPSSASMRGDDHAGHD